MLVYEGFLVFYNFNKFLVVCFIEGLVILDIVGFVVVIDNRYELLMLRKFDCR